MKLWIGAETQADVFDLFRAVRSDVQKDINSAIELRTYEIGVESWDCIVILRSDNDFKEIFKFSKARRDMDFRLQLDYEKFVAADDRERRRLLFELLLRSLSMLKSKGGNEKEIERLMNNVRGVGESQGWIP